jgi:hypothetical protein
MTLTVAAVEPDESIATLTLIFRQQIDQVC